MMLFQDSELDDEEMFEQLETKFLEKHTIQELEQLCIECGEDFCLACNKNQGEAI